MNNYISGKIAYSYYFRSSIHSALLYPVNIRIHTSSAAVKISSMNMYHQGFSRHLHCSNSCRIGKPVMGMNYIKLIFFSYN